MRIINGMGGKTTTFFMSIISTYFSITFIFIIESSFIFELLKRFLSIKSILNSKMMTFLYETYIPFKYLMMTNDYKINTNP